jgi:hypothetical protein
MGEDTRRLSEVVDPRHSSELSRPLARRRVRWREHGYTLALRC